MFQAADLEEGARGAAQSCMATGAAGMH